MDITPQPATQPSELESVMALAEKQYGIAPETVPATPEPAPAAASATPGDRAPEAAKVDVTTPDPAKPTGTPATQDPAKPAEQKEGSAFAKNQARLEGGWKTLNEGKAAFAKEQQSAQEALKQEREELNRQRAEWQAEQDAKAPKPEAYESEALKQDNLADKLENDGDFDKSTEARNLAKRCRAFANELRANPPKPSPASEAAKAEFAKQQKEWLAKAAIDFPATVKVDATGNPASPEAIALRKFVQENPDVMAHPKAFYFAADLAMQRTLAASVPQLRKDLEVARAEVKNLNEKLASPTGGAPSGQPAPPDISTMPMEQAEAIVRAETEALANSRSRR